MPKQINKQWTLTPISGRERIRDLLTHSQQVAVKSAWDAPFPDGVYEAPSGEPLLVEALGNGRVRMASVSIGRALLWIAINDRYPAEMTGDDDARNRFLDRVAGMLMSN
jgi:hypothetical protein